MRTTWVGTSWKMTKTLGEAEAWVDAVLAQPLPEGVRPFVLPAHTALATVRRRVPTDSRLRVGAQNAHWRPDGPGTGEVSMRMAADAGASMVELGHSERRDEHGETTATVARKVRAAVDTALTPLICVGEPEDVRRAGGAEEYVGDQVRGALSELAPQECEGVLVAYEPVWAIGASGRPPRPDELSPVMTAVRRELSVATRGAGCRGLLYGGSVDVENAPWLLGLPGLDGLFVGRAAWDPAGFRALLALAAA